MAGLVLLVVIVLVPLAPRLLRLRPVVMEYQAGLLYRNGRFRRRLTPGQHWLFRPTDTVTKVDLRPKLVSVTGQEVVTADGVSFKLSLACRFRVVRPEVAINQVEDYQQALYQVLQLSLRAIVSGSNGEDLLRARKDIGEPGWRRLPSRRKNSDSKCRPST